MTATYTRPTFGFAADAEVAGPVPAAEAREIADRYIALHMSTLPGGASPSELPTVSIPANPRRDADIRLHAFITQAETAREELARVYALLERYCPHTTVIDTMPSMCGICGKSPL